MSTLDLGILLRITEELERLGVMSGNFLDEDLLVGNKLGEVGRTLSQASPNYEVRFTKGHDIMLMRNGLIVFHGASTLNLDDIFWLLTKVETLHSEIKDTLLSAPNCLVAFVEGEGSVKLDMSQVYVEMSITEMDVADFIDKAEVAIKNLSSAESSRSQALNQLKLLAEHPVYSDDRAVILDLEDMLSKTVFTVSARNRFWKVFDGIAPTSNQQAMDILTRIRKSVSHVFMVVEKYS